MRNYFSNRINRSDGHASKVAPTDGIDYCVWKVEVRLGTRITEKLDPETEIKWRIELACATFNEIKSLFCNGYKSKTSTKKVSVE